MSNKELLILSILTLVTVVLWTIFEAYHVSVSSTIPGSLQEQIAHLTPTLNKNLVAQLKNRLDEENIPTPEITPSVINATPTAILTPEITPLSFPTASLVR